MEDRVPATGREGWVKLTQADGTVIEGKLEMNDNATVEGTPLNKNTLLADDVAELLGLPPQTATVSQAIKTSFEMALGDRTLISLSVLTPDGGPIPGVAVTLDGEYYWTDENGIINFDLTADGSTSFTFNLIKPWDLESLSQTQVVTGPIESGTVNRYSVTGTLKTLNATEELEITQSTNDLYFSGLFTVQKIWGCGGGGGGGAASGFNYYNIYNDKDYPEATGGAGGKTGLVTYTGKSPNIVMDITVGAGGVAQQNGQGTSGGTTTVKDKVSNSNLISATGGGGGGGNSHPSYIGNDGPSGGSGAGAAFTNGSFYTLAGDSGVDGGSGESVTYPTVNPPQVNYGGTGQGTTTRKFGESDETVYCNAGGSAAAGGSYVVGSSGAGAGAGKSISITSTQTVYGNDATLYGAGGGATVVMRAVDNITATVSGGAGMQGVVFIRIAKVVPVE